MGDFLTSLRELYQKKSGSFAAVSNNIYKAIFIKTFFREIQIEDWLQSTPISEEKKAFINKKTDALKKHTV